jgi:hypothetical protein
VLAFVAIVMVELLNPSSRGLVGGLAGARQHLEFVPLFFLGFAFVRTDSQIRTALLVLVFCAAVGGAVSYVQSTLSPSELAAWGPGYRDRIFGSGDFVGASRVAFGAGAATVRPFGLGSEVGSGASTAALALPAFVALFIAGSARIRWAIAPLSVGLALAVATSGARAATVTVFVGLAAFGLIAAASKNALKAIGGLALGVGLIYVAFTQLTPHNTSSQRAQSIRPDKALSTFSAERGASVTAFGDLATTHPLGVGLGTAGPASGFAGGARSRSFNAETEWNFLVLEVGVAGVVVYLAFLVRIMWLALTRIRRVAEPISRLYLAALAAPVFAMLVAGFSGPTSASVPSAPFLWLVSGILAYPLVAAYPHSLATPRDTQRWSGSPPASTTAE